MAVLRLDDRVIGALAVRVVAGDREAALQVVLLAGKVRDPRVDQLVDVAVDLDDADLQRHADLLRSEADAVHAAHGGEHVLEQPMQLLVEDAHAIAAHAEARVTKGHDLAGHDSEDTTTPPGRARPSLGSCVAFAGILAAIAGILPNAARVPSRLAWCGRPFETFAEFRLAITG